jgi:hypothetical protein
MVAHRHFPFNYEKYLFNQILKLTKLVRLVQEIKINSKIGFFFKVSKIKG